MRRFLDATLGRWTRHFFFIVVRGYYALFYNVSCSGKHLLQENPGALILATHVSRHDGPLVASILYTTSRVRPVVHYDEYHNPAQKLPMFVVSAIPVSSPKSWPAERRAAQKAWSLNTIAKVIRGGSAVLLFPAGKTRRQAQEIIEPYYSGAHDIMRAFPELPVMLLRIDGLGRFQRALYDSFWSFVGRTNGRRHVSVDIRPLPDFVDQHADLATFNAALESAFNTPISTEWDTPEPRKAEADVNGALDRLTQPHVLPKG
ncbi:MAG: 1-acyl-sn-glycerol-3-phosphate acyltransferase [Pseudomonadota bacterium]